MKPICNEWYTDPESKSKLFVATGTNAVLLSAEYDGRFAENVILGLSQVEKLRDQLDAWLKSKSKQALIEEIMSTFGVRADRAKAYVSTVGAGNAYRVVIEAKSGTGPHVDSDCSIHGVATWLINGGHKVIHYCTDSCRYKCELSGQETGEWCDGPLKPRA